MKQSEECWQAGMYVFEIGLVKVRHVHNRVNVKSEKERKAGTFVFKIL